MAGPSIFPHLSSTERALSTETTSLAAELQANTEALAELGDEFDRSLSQVAALSAFRKYPTPLRLREPLSQLEGRAEHERDVSAAELVDNLVARTRPLLERQADIAASLGVLAIRVKEAGTSRAEFVRQLTAGRRRRG